MLWISIWLSLSGRLKMKIQEHTPQGVTERELSQEELVKFANYGNLDARKEIAKQEVLAALNNDAKIAAILKFLGIK